MSNGAGSLGGFEVLRTARGRPFLVPASDVPRIDDTFLDCSIYLYKSKSAAMKGVASGGSGFLVAVPSDAHPDEIEYVYAVTASHVVKQGATTVRLSTKDGLMDAIPLKAHHWKHHASADIAVAPLLAWQPSVFRFAAVRVSAFLGEDCFRTANMDVGPGDDCFMVSRLVSHEGTQRNTPVVRFGNVSMMPLEPIKLEKAPPQLAFLVEMRSISGHSGSPVFVSPFTILRGEKAGTVLPPLLLGVAHGHLPIDFPLLDSSDARAEGGFHISLNAAQSVVIPAWKLRELLDRPEQMSVRQEHDELHAKKRDRPQTRADVADDESGPSSARGRDPERLKIHGTFADAARKLTRTRRPKG